MTSASRYTWLVVGVGGLDTFASNVAESLRQSGATVEHAEDGVLLPGMVNPYGRKVLNRLAPRVREIFVRRIERRLKQLQPDILLLTYDNFGSESIERFRRASSAKVVLWFPDAISNLVRQECLTADLDLYCFKDPWIVDRLQLVKPGRVIYLPEAFQPGVHDLALAEASLPDPVISVVGDIYPYRELILADLAGEFPESLQVHGYWPIRARSRRLPQFSGRYLRGMEKSRVFRRSAANVNSLHPAEILGVNCRLFEVAGAGGAQVVERRAALGDLFSLGSEVLVFSDLEGLRRQCNALVSDLAMSREIGDRARARAIREHTYLHRLDVLVRALESV